MKIRPSAITVVSAATGGGKTSFLLNVLSHFLDGNPVKAGVFWSYEESNFAILTKLLMIRLGASPAFGRELAEPDMFQAFLAAVRCPEEASPAFRAALDELEGFVDDGRLLLFDQSHSVDRFVEDVTYYDATRDVGLVVLDYIQRVPPEPGSTASAAYKAMQNISNDIERLAKERKLPVVMGAQVTEEGTGRNWKIRIRESQDIAMGAAVWLHIKNREGKADEDEPGGELRKIHVEKNRYGKKPAEPVSLEFHGPTFRFIDPAADDAVDAGKDLSIRVSDHLFLRPPHAV